MNSRRAKKKNYSLLQLLPSFNNRRRDVESRNGEERHSKHLESKMILKFDILIEKKAKYQSSSTLSVSMAVCMFCIQQK